MDTQTEMRPVSMVGGLILVLFGAVVGAWAGVLGESEHKDRQFAAERMAEADKPPLVIGNGTKLTVPGTSVLLGPVTIAQNPGKAIMPVFIEDNDRTKVLSCLLFDEKRRLLAGGSLALPPKLNGTDLAVEFQRKITSGSIQCKLVKP